MTHAVLDSPCRDHPPGPAAAKAAQGLLRLVELHPLTPPILHPIHDLRVSSMEFVEMKEERDQFEALLEHYTCIRCPEFNEHVSLIVMLHTKSYYTYFED